MLVDNEDDVLLLCMLAPLTMEACRSGGCCMLNSMQRIAAQMAAAASQKLALVEAEAAQACIRPCLDPVL